MDWKLYIAIAAAAAAVLWSRLRTRRVMESLDAMLDAAMEGDFNESRFDESLRSNLEAKLARYLNASALSARNVRGEKDKIKSLIADISHQTKTPISNILLYTQLLEEAGLPEESRVCLEALEGQAEKLQSLMEALVKTSRLETGIIALHPSREPLAPVMDAALAQLMPKASIKNIRVLREDTDAEAVFDPKWTEEALYNLLDNAVKYTPPGGEVRLRVRAFPMFAALEVSDTGPGIPEAEQPKVFQRFYRGDAHQGEEGVGIGLYLARKIAEDQGGYVKVRSKAGAGSTFSMYLPRS